MASLRDLGLAVACACAVVAACGPAPVGDNDDTTADDVRVPPPPYASLEERPCPDDFGGHSALTWENFGEPFVRNWCTACHSAQLDEAHRAGAPSTINLDTLDEVRALSERIWIRSADANLTMPPGGVPPVDERALLGEWLACGARARDDG